MNLSLQDIEEEVRPIIVISAVFIVFSYQRDLRTLQQTIHLG